MSPESIKAALWLLYEDVKEGDVDEERAEVMISVLDSLIEVEKLQAQRAPVARNRKESVDER